MVKGIGAQRGLSRIETVVGIVVLLVVVASLVMLKGKFRFDEPDAEAADGAAAASTPQTADPSTAAGIEGQLSFGPGSARLPAGAEDALGPLVATLRADALLNATVTADPAGSNADLARARAGAVRHAFEADGVSAARIVIEVAATRSPGELGGAGASSNASTAAGTASGAAASGVVRIRLQQR